MWGELESVTAFCGGFPGSAETVRRAVLCDLSGYGRYRSVRQDDGRVLDLECVTLPPRHLPGRLATVRPADRTIPAESLLRRDYRRLARRSGKLGLIRIVGKKGDTPEVETYTKEGPLAVRVGFSWARHACTDICRSILHTALRNMEKTEGQARAEWRAALKKAVGRDALDWALADDMTDFYTRIEWKVEDLVEGGLIRSAEDLWGATIGRDLAFCCGYSLRVRPWTLVSLDDLEGGAWKTKVPPGCDPDETIGLSCEYLKRTDARVDGRPWAMMCEAVLEARTAEQIRSQMGKDEQ